ncbi:MAG: hypothetical protein ABS46_06310 [Cytophagaceae bacterium SCN 52-12]|nr:MAG: hypothetical protein ABS46_06310 [Cytophagaceae bacterium SCN 52-12]
MSTRQYKILFFAIGIVTVAVLIYNTGWHSIVANIAAMGYWFLPVTGSWLVIYLLNAWAFHDIIREKDKPETALPFGEVFRLTITGYAINYVTPFVGLGGEPYRVMELVPRLGVTKAASSVLQYGLMHMLAHVAFWLASIALMITRPDLDGLLLAGCLVTLFTGLTLGYIFLRIYRQGFLVAALGYVSSWPLIGKQAALLLSSRYETLKRIDGQVTELYANRKPVFYRALFLEFAARVVGCAEIYFIGVATGPDMSWSDAVIVSSGSSLFANLVFFFPMQLGTREGGMALALGSIGLPAASGVFISLVTRIRELVWIAIGYALIYARNPNPEKRSGH